MLARPEVGTREHILLWLASKNPKKKYNWHNLDTCACAQYAYEHGGRTLREWTIEGISPNSPLWQLNQIAFFCTTFGELYKRFSSYCHYPMRGLNKISGNTARFIVSDEYNY